MVLTNSIDEVIVATVVWRLGSSSRAEETVGGPFELGVVAAGRADDSSAIAVKTSSFGSSVTVRHIIWIALIIRT